MDQDPIKDQVRLPMGVAFGVVLQGIRIRMGRSVVTVGGVVLGIAFLMAILTGQIIKEGVSDEERLRAEIRRMRGFLEAEMGPVSQRTIGVIQIGPLDDVEERFLRGLMKQGVGQINWVALRGDLERPALCDKTRSASLAEVGEQASAVLIVGKGSGALAEDWDLVFQNAQQRVIARTRKTVTVRALEGVSLVTLEQEMRPEEIEKQGEEKRLSRLRNVWITFIALAVTVMGISNAMLMSVTERFREIGTMKCLGALSAFIRQVFLIESALMGVVGALAGAIFGALFAVVAYSFTYGFGLVVGSLDVPTLLLYFLSSLVAGIVLSVVAAIYPAKFASRMVPATALRSNV